MLPENVRQALSALRHAGHGPTIQARWLANLGHQISKNTVGRHWLENHVKTP